MDSMLGGVLEQDLGSDFVFESNAKSLKNILEHRELSPNSLGYRQWNKENNDGSTASGNTIEFKSSLTPARHLPRSMKMQKDEFDFFEGKNGAVFYRKKLQVIFLAGPRLVRTPTRS